MTENPCLPLPPSQIRPAADLLARAFHADPLFVACLPDENKRARYLLWQFDRVIRYALRYGQCHTTTELEGVSCWLIPGATHFTLPRLLRTGIVLLPLKMGRTGYRRFSAFDAYTDQVHERCAPPYHWYLWVLGVDPAHQGQGVGSRLLQHVFEQADARGTACYLETGTERNVRFYEKHGFTVVDENNLNGVPFWAMLRP